jgi:pimeloyl-ACP methyl ester carboxylesterase
MLRYTAADGVQIAYYEWNTAGSGPPVVLQHGFAGSATSNWVTHGFVDALVRAGRRVIALDARGHGESDKPHDPALHGEDAMARDVMGVVDQLGAASYDLVGYSMGAIIAAAVAAQDARVRRLVVGGVGGYLVQRARPVGRVAFNAALADALDADDPSTITDEVAAGLRAFAEFMCTDRRSLAALARSPRACIALDRIAAPTLLVVGAADPLALQPELLAQAIPGARLQLLAGDHLSVLRNTGYAPALVAFLS